MRDYYPLNEKVSVDAGVQPQIGKENHKIKNKPARRKPPTPSNLPRERGVLSCLLGVACRGQCLVCDPGSVCDFFSVLDFPRCLYNTWDVPTHSHMCRRQYAGLVRAVSVTPLDRAFTRLAPYLSPRAATGVAAQAAANGRSREGFRSAVAPERKPPACAGVPAAPKASVDGG